MTLWHLMAKLNCVNKNSWPEQVSSLTQQLSPLRYPLCDSRVLNALEKSAQHSYELCTATNARLWIMLNAPSAWSFGREAVWAKVFEEWRGLTNPTPSCMTVIGEHIFAQSSMAWFNCSDEALLCRVHYLSYNVWNPRWKCNCEGPSQSERLRLTSERIKLKLPFRRPNLKAWLNGMSQDDVWFQVSLFWSGVYTGL